MIARFRTHKRLRTHKRSRIHKPGWRVVALLGLLVAGCGVRTNAGPESPDASTTHFLRPMNPKGPFEAGDLWAMPAPDGRLRISPLRQWSQTGLELREGQRLEIQAEGHVQGCQRPVGEWAYGPFGPSGGPVADDPGSRVCALIGRIVGEGETREFIVGESFQGEIPFPGRLDLGVSDIRHFDNSGEFLATIWVDGRPADFTRRQAAALTVATKNLAPAMRPMNEVEIREVDGARRMSARREADLPMLATEQCFTPPLEIRARARTDSTNIRLYYGYFGWGQLIFNWEVRPDELRIHDPASGAIRGFRGAGGIEKDKFHNIVWRVGLRQMQVLVDGEERHRGIGDYRAVASPVGIGPALGSQVDVESLVVAPLDPAAMDEPTGAPTGTPLAPSPTAESAAPGRRFNDGPPAIVDTSPKVGATEVNPNLAEITVTFDREMAGGFSWTGGGAYYPPGREGEKPHWSADRRTCSFPVKLEAGKYYRIGINSKSYQNFRSAAGAPAQPAAIYFTTRGASEDLKAMVGKPHVVSMEPASGARDVDPAITELRVTFDVPMGGGFSWTGGGPEFPKGREDQRPHWSEDGRICVFPVTLEPGKSYCLGLNSPSHKNFSSRGGVPLDPVVYTFSTKDEH